MLGRDGISGLVCLLGSLGLLALTRGLPHPALVPIGPAFYPRIVLVATAILSVVLLGSALLARRRRRPAEAASARRNYRLVALIFAIFAAYVLVLPLLGYRVATFFFVLALQPALQPAGERHWLRVLAVAVGTALLTHVAFETYLSVLLPRGRWTGI